MEMSIEKNNKIMTKIKVWYRVQKNKQQLKSFSFSITRKLKFINKNSLKKKQNSNQFKIVNKLNILIRRNYNSYRFSWAILFD